MASDRENRTTRNDGTSDGGRGTMRKEGASIYVSLESHDKFREHRNYYGKQIEEKRDPSVIHKYRGWALVPKSLIVKFTDGKPTIIMYDDQVIGNASFEKKNDSDVCYQIGFPDKFKKYMDAHHEFFLSIDHVNDGFVFAHTAKITGTTAEQYDFTNYDDCF